jgi:DNA-binding GntR family transcriptional regulator
MKLNTTTKPNHSKRAAGPIKDSEDIQRIRSILSSTPRDLLLFDLAVETGTGMKKILQMKVKDIAGKQRGEPIMTGSGQGQKYPVFMTDTLYDSLQKYLEEIRPRPDDYLIKSKKGQRPLNLSTVSNMITDWFDEAKIKGCFGAISLRKTWEYNNVDKSNVVKGTASPNHMSIFKPFETPSAQQTVFNELFNAIVSCKIPPGTRITTAEISKAFNLSQAPVRVALNWLEAKGFIISQKKKGSFVKELTIEELHEIIQIRLILETAAARLSYRIITEETLKLIESITEKYKNAYDFAESDQLNRLFHQTLYRDAKMPLLTIMVNDLYDRFSPYAALAFSRTTRLPDHKSTEDLPEYYHIKILEGLRRKNIGEILKYLKLKINRAILITEEILKHRG